MLERSAIILAGGSSSRLGQDKGLVQLGDRPLIRHVMDKVKDLVGERIVVASSGVQAQRYSNALDEGITVLVDGSELHGPLVGARVGFENSCGEYSLLLPCDTPFASIDVLHLLLELSIDRNAAIPRWPNCYIEPLHAVYRTKAASEAARKALSSGRLNMRAMVEGLQRVRYVSTLVLEQLDPGLKTFFNVNTGQDLKRAEAMLRRS